MHKDACACQRDPAAPLSAGFALQQPVRNSASRAGMSNVTGQKLTTLSSDTNNNSKSKSQRRGAKFAWDETAIMNAMNGNSADARGVAMETGGRECSCKANLMLNEQMLEQLNGMSLTERLTPRITLTSVDGDDENGQRCAVEDMMTDAIGQVAAPKFLTVPKLQEVGKERRPPVMVKTV